MVHNITKGTKPRGFTWEDNDFTIFSEELLALLKEGNKEKEGIKNNSREERSC